MTVSPVASRASKSKKSVTFSAAYQTVSGTTPTPTTIDLSGHYPPIDTLDPALKGLRGVRQLSLSTNAISTIQNLPENIVILSLGRNLIKRLDGIQTAAESLQQLWISYNAIDSLKGIESMKNLSVLYASNNMISSWEEIDRLAHLEHLHDVLFVGNPLHARYHNVAKNDTRGPLDGPAVYVREMRKRLGHLKKLDGKLLTDDVDDGCGQEAAPGCCK